jgi:hypothetical protein
MMLAACGDTVTEPMGLGVMVSVTSPVFPSAVARIVTVPGAVEVTIPPELTEAIASLVLDQAKLRPESALPAASLAVAASCIVCPTRIPLDGPVT